MEKFRNSGLVRKIGVSVYDSDQIDHLLSEYDIDIVQLPINILDQRLINSGHLNRSIFNLIFCINTLLLTVNYSISL